MASSVALGATDLTYWGENRGADLLTITNGSTDYLTEDGFRRADASVVTELKTAGSTTYNLVFSPTSDGDEYAPNFALNDAIYLNSLTIGTSLPTSYTIAFGTNGSITTDQNINFGTSVTAFSFSASMTDAQLAQLATGAVVTRDLLTGRANWGIWNYVDKGTKTFTVDNVGDAYEYVGAVGDVAAMAEGTYGYVYSDSSGTDKVTLVVKGIAAPPVPEPATATLSLLALVGLAARRRRK
ncbi:MAG: PEP-CTERM sorting domain-containing protein [Akkermansia sp.]|nr:PEP-CTERM sorting domain-containing protein [Akkermansia sp.]